MSQITIDREKMMKLFNLPKNYTAEQLKAAYKHLVIKYHPDKSMKVTDTPMFQMLTSFYKTLAEEHAARKNQREFYELKAEYKSGGGVRHTPAPMNGGGVGEGNKFDVKMFNKFFEQHKVDDVYEKGYKDWIENPNSFKETSKHAVQVYREPKPMVSGADSVPCYELGLKAVTDHSAQNDGGLHYTDYRLAHTTDKIVDPSRVRARKDYRNVHELEADRARVSFNMSPREVEAFARHQAEQAKREQMRLAEIKARDEIIERQFERMNLTLQNAGMLRR